MAPQHVAERSVHRTQRGMANGTATARQTSSRISRRRESQIHQRTSCGATAPSDGNVRVQYRLQRSDRRVCTVGPMCGMVCQPNLGRRGGCAAGW